MLAAHPKNGEAHLLQAQIMLVREQPEQAIEALTAAVNSQPDSPGYRYELVSLLLSQHRDEAAQA